MLGPQTPPNRAAWSHRAVAGADLSASLPPVDYSSLFLHHPVPPPPCHQHVGATKSSPGPVHPFIAWPVVHFPVLLPVPVRVDLFA